MIKAVFKNYEIKIHGIYEKGCNIEEMFFVPITKSKNINNFKDNYKNHKSNDRLLIDILRRNKINLKSENVLDEILEILNSKEKNSTCYKQLFKTLILITKKS